MSTGNTTRMYREIREIPDVTRRLLSDGVEPIIAAAAQLRDLNPSVLMTVARGSSDHAATYFKYACEIQMGIPVASIGPSVASIYKAKLNLKNAACLSVSQSGQSPDIVEMVDSARKQGALSIAIEKSVAATKTFVASVVTELALLAHWSDDKELIAAINSLPDVFEKAVECDWPQLSDVLLDAQMLFVLGRGLSSAVAGEAALKFKETCRIHAESYSTAEVLHGPISIADPGFPVLVLCARDASEETVAIACDHLAQQGANVLATTDKVRDANQLNFATTGHPMTDALSLVVSFYSFVERFSRRRGFDPDIPRYLNKVTQTM